MRTVTVQISDSDYNDLVAHLEADRPGKALVAVQALVHTLSNGTANPDHLWVVMCRVSGGVTGTRQQRLKANGIELRFPTYEAAFTEATRLTAKQNGPTATAHFEYWPEHLGGEHLGPRR